MSPSVQCRVSRSSSLWCETWSIMGISLSKKDRVALFDVCNTIVDVYTITDFTENFLLPRARYSEISVWRRLVHFVLRFLRGRTSLLTSYPYRAHLMGLFRGYSESDLAAVVGDYTEHLKKHIKTSALLKLNELKQGGYRIILVTAGLDAYLKPFAAYLGADLVSTVLEKDALGNYTGRIVGVDCLGGGKVTNLRSKVPLFDAVDLKQSFAFGDTVSDVPMLSLVGNVWTVDPDRELEQWALENKWSILRTV